MSIGEVSSGYALALSVLSGVLVAAIIYIITSTERNNNRRQDALHEKLNTVHATMIALIEKVARLEAQNDLARMLHAMEERIKREGQ